MIATRPLRQPGLTQSGLTQPASSYPAAVQAALAYGEVITQIQPPSSRAGAAVTATMQVPLSRPALWNQLTNYPRWTQFFPDITHSEVLAIPSRHRTVLRQAARKSFLLLTMAVEIQLQVDEIPQESIRFSMLDGGNSFRDFAAVLEFKSLSVPETAPETAPEQTTPWGMTLQPGTITGTIISYTVQATPTLPLPQSLLEQAMKFDLPQNMRHLRRMVLS